MCVQYFQTSLITNENVTWVLNEIEEETDTPDTLSSLTIVIVGKYCVIKQKIIDSDNLRIWKRIIFVLSNFLICSWKHFGLYNFFFQN